MRRPENILAVNRKWAKRIWTTELTRWSLTRLDGITLRLGLSVIDGDLCLLNGQWYVTNHGLLKLADQRGCAGIQVTPLEVGCDLSKSHWLFKATVYKTVRCKGFVGYGDADPSNVPPLLQGAEMRIAETRAVNRALRKAYGIGICSIEELASPAASSVNTRKTPPQSPRAQGGYGGPKLRDRLCQLIRQHRLDANLVKSYAVDFCGTKILRAATREQIEAFVAHLSDWAEKDQNALLCHLNSYLRVEDHNAGKNERQSESRKEARKQMEGEKEGVKEGAA
jgi:hypothetical protein